MLFQVRKKNNSYSYETSHNLGKIMLYSDEPLTGNILDSCVLTVLKTRQFKGTIKEKQSGKEITFEHFMNADILSQ